MPQILKFLTAVFLCSITLNVQANPYLDNDDKSTQPDDGFLPVNILQMDETFSHHVVVAEKSTHKVHLFSNKYGKPKYIKSYNAATGKRKGNKISQGDLKTPEGVYQLIDFYSDADLIKKYGKEGEIYGAGAFVMNYPNPMDSFAGKSGGGIWLHSTNDNKRVNKGLDSRGCVVVIDEDLKDLSKYIELNRTSMIVVQDLHYVSGTTWNNKRKELWDFLDLWKTAWETEDLISYLKSYHPRKFRDPVRGNYAQFSTYKHGVFKNPGKPKIEVSNVSISFSGHYAVIQFLQHYSSYSINDTGKKTLYLEQDENYDWKIVSEIWQKYTDQVNEKVAFTPSMRFFESD